MKFFIVLSAFSAITILGVSSIPLSKAVKERTLDGIWDGLSENVERQIAESLFDMILYGIDGGRGIGRDGSTRLHLAARRGNLKNVLAEIEDGEDVDVTDLLGNTPLHEATLNGNANVVKVLLENDADVTAENNKGKTPIDVAISQGRDQILKMLVKAEENDFEDRRLRLKYSKKSGTLLK